MLRVRLGVYRTEELCQVVVCVYITRRGQALRCLSLLGGNAKA